MKDSGVVKSDAPKILVDDNHVPRLSLLLFLYLLVLSSLLLSFAIPISLRPLGTTSVLPTLRITPYQRVPD